jgi:hypothetical protein
MQYLNTPDCEPKVRFGNISLLPAFLRLASSEEAFVLYFMIGSGLLAALAASGWTS